MAKLHCWFPLFVPCVELQLNAHPKQAWAVVSHHFSIMLVVSSWILPKSGSLPSHLFISL